MNEAKQARCPECDGDGVPQPALDRRGFVRVLGGTALLAAAGVPTLLRAGDDAKKPIPAEAMIHELAATINEPQKTAILLPFDHGPKNGIPTRLGMYNSPVMNKKICDVYTKTQKELIERTLRSLLNGDEGYRRISRNGSWDSTKAF